MWRLTARDNHSKCLNISHIYLWYDDDDDVEYDHVHDDYHDDDGHGYDDDALGDRKI